MSQKTTVVTRAARLGDRLIYMPCCHSGFVDSENRSVNVSVREGTRVKLSDLDQKERKTLGINSMEPIAIFQASLINGHGFVFEDVPGKHIPLTMLDYGLVATVNALPAEPTTSVVRAAA